MINPPRISSSNSSFGFISISSLGIKKALTLSFFIGGFAGFIQAASAAPPVNALPINGQVVAGSASISQTQTPTSAAMTVNQTSQRAVVNWDSFNVGKNATVTFNQPNANSVTLNRVTGATASMIEGAVKANGQVVFVNPNGVTFGKGAEINAAGVVATTMDISNKDFMDGKGTYKGNGKGSVINEGKISTNAEGGYIALLAPEVRNDGYLLAKKGSGTVAMAAGEQITLDFKGNSLMSVKVDVGTYNALIENKRVVEVNGGLVVIAAGSANQLMASVIKNTGRISAGSMVNNGGVIELVANTVTQAGKVTANSKTGEGGQINIVGNDITIAQNSKTTATGTTNGGQVNIGLAATAVSGGSQVNASVVNPTQAAQNVKANADAAAKNNQLAQTVAIQENALIDASATQAGNGGVIAIWSQVQTSVAGILKSMGGAISGNGGFVETSSKGSVSLVPTASINTSAVNGKAGTWLLDPVDLMIDASTANTISTALSTGNVTIAVTANTTACSVGSCIVNGTGSMTVDSGAHILKAGTSYTTLTMSAAGNFVLNGSIEGQNLDVIISSSIAYLGAAGSSINASKITIQAPTITIASNARVLANNYLFSGGAGTLGNAIELLAQAIYISGALRLSAGLPTVPAAPLTAVNLITLNAVGSGNTIYSSAAANDPTLLVVNSTTQAASNVIYLTATQIIPTNAAIVGLESGSQVLANGTTGGAIYLAGTDVYTGGAYTDPITNLVMPRSQLQANGVAGDGGMIGIKADTITIAGEASAGGSVNGGSINLIANTGTLNLHGGLIQANGGSGSGGSISALVTAAASFTADNHFGVALAGSSFDLSNTLFITENTATATSGSLNLGYQLTNASGTTITLGAGSYANLSISGTPSYLSNASAITNSVGAGSYPNLIVKGVTLSGMDSGHFMLVATPVSLTVSAAQPAAPSRQPATTSVQAVAAVAPQQPPPPPPPPPAVFSSAPLPAPAPPPVANTPPPTAAAGETSMSVPGKAPPLVMMADGSIQLTPPAPPPTANASAPPPPPPPAAPPPPSNRASSNRESGDGRSAANNSEARRNGSAKDGVDKTDAKERSSKSNNGPSKYVSKYANGFRNNDKPGSKAGAAKDLAANRPGPNRVGKYENRVQAMGNNPAAFAAMKQNPFAGSILPFPAGVQQVDTTPIILRGGDSLAQSYDDVPSIRNSGVATVGRSRNSENFHESLESVNLMSTLNLFILH
ncbi:filamentous hemagglutinin N-terminal domain-containing protein [Polynucleobacter sp. AP-RePozz3-80-G7]|nr:filamentous hemagglutinin N-terminal domain-containing protein [Polynucleobacter sp. AP-RePozz3-80-G7]